MPQRQGRRRLAESNWQELGSGRHSLRGLPRRAPEPFSQLPQLPQDNGQDRTVWLNKWHPFMLTVTKPHKYVMLLTCQEPRPWEAASRPLQGSPSLDPSECHRLPVCRKRSGWLWHAEAPDSDPRRQLQLTGRRRSAVAERPLPHSLERPCQVEGTRLTSEAEGASWVQKS